MTSCGVFNCSQVERWLPVVDWEEVAEVSSCGRVRTLDREVRTTRGVQKLKGIMRKPYMHVDGYPMLSLRFETHRQTFLVHRMVLEAFAGPRPEGMEACHGDGNPTNNHLSNLRWDTHQANVFDTIEHGNHHLVNRTHCPLGHLLVAPNLTPSARPAKTRMATTRVCLACNRAYAARGRALRKGLPFDRQAVADRYYEDIMATAGELVSA